jgi:N-acetylmuramoyl-L-alanine amidase
MRLGYKLGLLISVLWAAPAFAGVPHTVQPGETLWSIAAANNFTTRALAAANGLSPDANVVLGSTITIPSESEAATALTHGGYLGSQSSASSGQVSAGYTVRPGDTLTGIAAALGVSPAALAAANGVSSDGFVYAGTTLRIPGTSSSAPAPEPLGGYTVRPGETLSAIAAAAGVPVEQIAYMNGLDPHGVLLAGTVLKLPTGSSAPADSAPAPATLVVPAAAPNPTSEHVTSAQIAQIAAAQGVSPSLASAIAWQESGFSNAVVSGANARGVMQIVPGTWDWLNRYVANDGLNPNSALDNVRGGVLYLRQLLRDFGGDENSAIAAYYQGEGAVRSRGILPETQRYIANIDALRARFGN